MIENYMLINTKEKETLNDTNLKTNYLQGGGYDRGLSPEHIQEEHDKTFVIQRIYDKVKYKNTSS